MLLYRFEELLQGKNGRSLFANRIMSDGYSIDVSFARRPSLPHETVALELDDFATEEIEHFFDPCACDPGLTNVYVAAYGGSNEPHSVRQFTTAEYYTMLQSKERNKCLEAKKAMAGIAAIERDVPNSKTADPGCYDVYISYMLRHMETLEQFYDVSTALTRFRGYQLKQRARHEMANILLDGGLKYNRTRRKKKKKKNKRAR